MKTWKNENGNKLLSDNKFIKLNSDIKSGNGNNVRTDAKLVSRKWQKNHKSVYKLEPQILDSSTSQENNYNLNSANPLFFNIFIIIIF